MKIGLIGLSNSGKTTILNALAQTEAEVTSYANTNAEPNVAIVNVGDNRIDRLSIMFNPQKTTYATIELVDFIGFAQGAAKEGAFASSLMQEIKTMDALALIVRNFQDGFIDASSPLKDIALINEELLFSDLIITEKRLERIEWSYKRGLKTSELLFEENVLKKVLDQLNNNEPIRKLTLNNDEKKSIRGYQFLTQKPLLIILNSDEGNFGKNESLVEDIQKQYDVIEFAGNFEMELSKLDLEEAQMFMDDIGIKDSARDRLTQFVYKMLGYNSFFTIGTDEVRAWNILNGQTAVDAAGVIHSDLARGFIRAECFTYNDLIECGSEHEVKKKGRFRLEGKDYLVKDGDILSIRFNV